jgi:hypothetical protein
LTSARVSFSRQGSDANYGPETVRCELELSADDGDVLRDFEITSALRQARAHVDETLDESPGMIPRAILLPPAPPVDDEPDGPDVDDQLF